MPTITNFNLSIDKGTGGSRRRVVISYRINFTASERMAGAVFNEQVTLRGSDPLMDDKLTTIYTTSVKAPADPPYVDRSITRMVSRDELDEDTDVLVSDRDELYARVRLEPFMPMPVQIDSNMVYGYFGQMGSD